MSQVPTAIFKIPTESPQPGRKVRRPSASAKHARTPAPVVSRVTRSSILLGETRDDGVIELTQGITVYPPREDGARWRAVWTEDCERRQCESVSEETLAEKLEKVAERLALGAVNMTRPGSALVDWYLNPDRLPVDSRWSRKHADTQRRLCDKYIRPVIDTVTCQDLTVSHTQKIVNAAPTAGEGDRVRRGLSSLVGAGLKGGYLINPMLAEVHWQAGDRALPDQKVSVAGESAMLVDPAEIPSSGDVSALGRALKAGAGGWRDELMANLAAYSGLRWGEIASLAVEQVDQGGRVITVDRKVVEVAGKLYREAPKNRKHRRTIYPRRTPEQYPLADLLAARIEEVLEEKEEGSNPLGLLFPASNGSYWRSSNFNRRRLKPAYLAAGWRGDVITHDKWTWHSLRHVFCTTALFVWKLDPTDVSRMAGHSNYRITLDMYVGTTAGVLDRARSATE